MVTAHGICLLLLCTIEGQIIQLIEGSSYKSDNIVFLTTKTAFRIYGLRQNDLFQVFL